jgi:hypothetical protein
MLINVGDPHSEKFGKKKKKTLVYPNCVETFQIGPSLKAFRKSINLLNEWGFEIFINV